MSHYSLLEIRGSLVDTRILIRGDAMPDRFMYGNIERNAGWAVALLTYCYSSNAIRT